MCSSHSVRPTRRGYELSRKRQSSGIETCITMTPLLLVKNNENFADDLISTGVKKFIAQPFHFRRGKFIAGTHDKAYHLMAEKLGCGLDNFGKEYMERYQEFFEVFDDKLKHNGLPGLEEGKDGFAPPF